MRKIFLDLDGVIVDFVPAAFAMGGVTLEKESDYPEGFGWDIVGAINKLRRASSCPGCPISGKQFWDSLNFEFWYNLPMYRGAMGLITALEQYGEVYFATSPTLAPSCVAGKYAWVKAYFPRFRKKLFIGASKDVFAANEGAILIDDRDRNCDDFITAGGRSILVPRPWNNAGYTPDPYAQIMWEMEELCD
jgi:hypothetical protein